MSEFSDIPREIGPANLPAGERVLWRGKPDWRVLALEAFGAPWVVFYFVAIGTWHLSVALRQGATRLEALSEASTVLIPMLLALSLVALMAWLSARSTAFTVTDRRIVLCFGIALPALVNLPLDAIDAVRLRRSLAGRGDLAFSLPRNGRLSFHQLWPYARPWHLFPASPMLRAVPRIEEVAVIVSDALEAVAVRDTDRASAPAALPADPAARPAPLGAPRPATAAA